MTTYRSVIYEDGSGRVYLDCGHSQRRGSRPRPRVATCEVCDDSRRVICHSPRFTPKPPPLPWPVRYVLSRAPRP